MDVSRSPQLAYSDSQALMLDEASRRAKAQKIIAALRHFRGVDSLAGLTVADVGCSGGTIAAEICDDGAHVVGIDIDVPGVRKAQDRYRAGSEDRRPHFLCADSMSTPLSDRSVDIVVCNHIYEHVVSPEALAAELRRIVKPEGIVYLGLGNKWGVVEPHYRLPFLSYLPRAAADRYVRVMHRADEYYEHFYGRRGLRRLFAAFDVWDYTHAILAEPELFAMRRAWPPRLSGAVSDLSRVLRPVVPTFIWLATARPTAPRGPRLRRQPLHVPAAPAARGSSEGHLAAPR